MEKLLDAIEKIEGFSAGTEEYVEMRKIIDTQRGDTRNIEQYQLDDRRWLFKTEAIEMTGNGNIENAVVVRPIEENTYLRSKPDPSPDEIRALVKRIRVPRED